MDMLWISCLCDRYTGNQRVKFDSPLNKQGIEIAQYMSQQLQYPVYYHLACDYGKSIKTEQVNDQITHVCPKCETIMKRVGIPPNHEIDVCQNCNLSFDAH
jgi:predicted  nucleic acid-binding Zn ribbon protein